MTKIKPGEKAKAIMEEATKFMKTRVQISYNTLKEIENGIRSSVIILFNLEFPPTMSEKFEMSRRNAVKKNRRNFLDNAFPRYKQLMKKRIIT